MKGTVTVDLKEFEVALQEEKRNMPGTNYLDIADVMAVLRRVGETESEVKA